MPFKIVRSDLTKMQVDAIVNTANSKPEYSLGTDVAVYKAVGEGSLLAESKKIGYLNEGDVTITQGFKLDMIEIDITLEEHGLPCFIESRKVAVGCKIQKAFNLCRLSAFCVRGAKLNSEERINIVIDAICDILYVKEI